MNRKGVTLIELLIALTSAVIVCAAGYSLFTKEFNFSVLQTRTTQMQQDVRSGLEIMTREIRAAGFGVIEPLTGTLQPTAATPIQPGDNVDPDPWGVTNQLDRITVTGGYYALGTLNATPAPGATTVIVALLPGVKFPSGLNPVAPNQPVTIEGAYYGQVVTSALAGNLLTLNLNNPMPSNRPFSTLDNVFLVQSVTYHVAVPAGGGEPVLYRNDGSGDQVIASGIEDLQITYLMSDGSTQNNPPAIVLPPAGVQIMSVRVALVARAIDPNTSATTSSRPAVMNHTPPATRDRYHRRLIYKAVEVRNLGYF